MRRASSVTGLYWACVTDRSCASKIASTSCPRGNSGQQQSDVSHHALQLSRAIGAPLPELSSKGQDGRADRGVHGGGASGLPESSPVQPGWSPLRRHPLPALADQVRPGLRDVKAQHPPAVTHLDTAIAGDVGIGRLDQPGPAGIPGAGNADDLVA